MNHLDERFNNGKTRLFYGDSREVLREMPDESVHCVVTSPPYYGVRDYGNGEEGIGLEESLEEHMEALLDLFGEIFRVLHPSGTIWVNLGDSYSVAGVSSARDMASKVDGTARYNRYHKESGAMERRGALQTRDGRSFRSERYTDRSLVKSAPPIAGVKPKELIGYPFRVALALQAAGWYLRSDIIWSKPNPMPESSKLDRPAKAHEYLFLLSKKRNYYYDGYAVREKGISAVAEYRNKRTIWEIPTQAYRDSHTATFPEKLVVPCVLAGTSEHGVCPECLAPYVRTFPDRAPTMELDEESLAIMPQAADPSVEPTGWAPGCRHDAGSPIPATVLDPFIGTGTTCVVAQRLNRKSLGIDIQEEYLRIAQKRLEGVPIPML